jgi:hypothetical protein
MKNSVLKPRAARRYALNVDGVVKDGFEGVRHAFVEAQAGGEGGAQLCVIIAARWSSICGAVATVLSGIRHAWERGDTRVLSPLS